MERLSDSEISKAWGRPVSHVYSLKITVKGSETGMTASSEKVAKEIVTKELKKYLSTMIPFLGANPEIIIEAERLK